MKEARLKILNDCLDAIKDAHDVLEEVRDEEEEAYDNMPEGLQYSDRGDMMQEAVDTLDEAVEYLDDAISNLEDAISTADNPDIWEIDPWQSLKVGDKVNHKSFGEGVINNIEGGYVYIHFADKDAKFIFPDAIEKGFITL